jgi:predicted DNA-binding transcriptional regulator AlpA
MQLLGKGWKQLKNMETKMVLESLLSEREVARCLAVSLATIRRWRLLGGGPKYLKIGSSVRYQPSELKAYLESRPMGGGVPREVKHA